MKILSFIMFFISFSVLADSVRIYDASNLSVTGTIAGINVTLGSDAPSGDATTDTAPARVYIPVQNGNSNDNYSTLKKTSSITSLYNITLASHYVMFPLSLTVGGTAKYIYMAVRGGASGTGYYVSAKSSATYSNISSSQVNFSITPKDICKSIILNGVSTFCNPGTGALDPSSTTNVLFKPMLYFFVTDQDITPDGSTTIDPGNANYSGGVYFEAQMSNRVFDTIIVTLSELRKGDKRLIGTYSSSSSIDTSLMKKVFAYSYNDTTTPVGTNVAIGAAGAGTILSNDLGASQSGEFILNGLTNNRPYNIAIAFEDKFHFATKLSTSTLGTPTAIEELLKKQACFILTAGFGEEHYVTNYFRSYRDHVLANSWMGRILIKAYYSTAPRAALFIYKHEAIRSVIRGFAYVIYFFFNYGLVTLLLLSSCFYLDILRKNKIIITKNRL